MSSSSDGCPRNFGCTVAVLTPRMAASPKPTSAAPSDTLLSRLRAKTQLAVELEESE